MKKLIIILGAIALLLLLRPLLNMGGFSETLDLASLDGITQSVDSEFDDSMTGAIDGLQRFYNFTGFSYSKKYTNPPASAARKGLKHTYIG